MTMLPLIRGRGGNHHPIAFNEFITNRLNQVGEDYIGGLHQAYKDALDKIAWERRRVFLYHHPTYYCFFLQVKRLLSQGLLEYSGRELPSDDSRFNTWRDKPMRRYVRLATK